MALRNKIKGDLKNLPLFFMVTYSFVSLKKRYTPYQDLMHSVNKLLKSCFEGTYVPLLLVRSSYIFHKPRMTQIKQP